MLYIQQNLQFYTLTKNVYGKGVMKFSNLKILGWKSHFPVSNCNG
ncbi:conserved hypothetical protein [Vibrio diabolicus]|nr:conserved hypothetical protein [Vibrio diabolicus]